MKKREELCRQFKKNHAKGQITMKKDSLLGEGAAELKRNIEEKDENMAKKMNIWKEEMYY